MFVFGGQFQIEIFEYNNTTMLFCHVKRSKCS